MGRHLLMSLAFPPLLGIRCIIPCPNSSGMFPEVMISSYAWWRSSLIVSQRHVKKWGVRPSIPGQLSASRSERASHIGSTSNLSLLAFLVYSSHIIYRCDRHSLSVPLSLSSFFKCSTPSILLSTNISLLVLISSLS